MSLKPIHFFLFIFSISCFSQEYRVTGHVKDANNNPVAYANVVITKSAEDIQGIANGTSTDENGYFIIEGLQTGNYALKISSLGYTVYNTTIELNKNLKLRGVSSTIKIVCCFLLATFIHHFFRSEGRVRRTIIMTTQDRTMVEERQDIAS